MKLLGYERVTGTKNEKSWDFVRLYVEKENATPTLERGGSIPITTYSKDHGTGFPCIKYSDFNNLVDKGLRPGSNINLFKDFSGNVICTLNN